MVVILTPIVLMVVGISGNSWSFYIQKGSKRGELGHPNFRPFGLAIYKQPKVDPLKQALEIQDQPLLIQNRLKLDISSFQTHECIYIYNTYVPGDSKWPLYPQTLEVT